MQGMLAPGRHVGERECPACLLTAAGGLQCRRQDGESWPAIDPAKQRTASLQTLLLVLPLAKSRQEPLAGPLSSLLLDGTGSCAVAPPRYTESKHNIVSQSLSERKLASLTYHAADFMQGKSCMIGVNQRCKQILACTRQPVMDIQTLLRCTGVKGGHFAELTWLRHGHMVTPKLLLSP